MTYAGKKRGEDVERRKASLRHCKVFQLEAKVRKIQKTKSGQIQETKSGQKHAKGEEHRKAETSICQNRREKYQHVRMRANQTRQEQQRKEDAVYAGSGYRYEKSSFL